MPVPKAATKPQLANDILKPKIWQFNNGSHLKITQDI